MRLKTPRVPPLEESEAQGEAKELLAEYRRPDGIPRIFRTLAHHPKLLKRWTTFGNHILFKSTLPPREREILILRIGWLCKAVYEFSAHVRIGKETGLTDEEIERIKAGPDAPGWSPADATLVRAVDELREDAMLSDATWKELSQRYDTQQLMDVVFTVGQYNLVCMALNTLGVQPEVPLPDFPS